MDFVYGLDDVAEVEEAGAPTVLALQAEGEPIALEPASTLIEVTGEGSGERHLWNVVMTMVRHFNDQEQPCLLYGLEGRDGPQGLELLAYLDEELHQRLTDEDTRHQPIVAIFPKVDGLPEEHAWTFQTLVLKSNRVNIYVITTVAEAGLLPMLFPLHIRVDDPDGYEGTIVGKYDQTDQVFVAPHFERQDINQFKKRLGK